MTMTNQQETTMTTTTDTVAKERVVDGIVGTIAALKMTYPRRRALVDGNVVTELEDFIADQGGRELEELIAVVADALDAKAEEHGSERCRDLYARLPLKVTDEDAVEMRAALAEALWRLEPDRLKAALLELTEPGLAAVQGAAINNAAERAKADTVNPLEVLEANAKRALRAANHLPYGAHAGTGGLASSVIRTTKAKDDEELIDRLSVYVDELASRLEDTVAAIEADRPRVTADREELERHRHDIATLRRVLGTAEA